MVARSNQQAPLAPGKTNDVWLESGGSGTVLRSSDFGGIAEYLKPHGFGYQYDKKVELLNELKSV